KRIIFFQTRGGMDAGLENADLSGYVALGNAALDIHDYFGARYGDGRLDDPYSSSFGESQQQLSLSVLSRPGQPYIGNVLGHERLVLAAQKILAPTGFPLI